MLLRRPHPSVLRLVRVVVLPLVLVPSRLFQPEEGQHPLEPQRRRGPRAVGSIREETKAPPRDAAAWTSGVRHVLKIEAIDGKAIRKSALH